MKTKTKFILGTILTIVLVFAFVISSTNRMNFNVNNIITASAKSNSESLSDIQEEKIAINHEINLSKKNKIEASKKNMDELQNKIKSYIGTDIANIGLTYIDLESGNTIEINSDKEFLAASTVKVPMNMVLFDMIKNNKISINDTMTYDEDTDFEDGTGKLDEAQLSSPIPIKTLSDYSILYSDNIATNMLIRKIGYDNLKDSIETKLGHKINRSGNYTTANNSATLLKLLYENPTNNPYYANIVNDMKHTIFHDRIDKYIPKQLTAHKIGNYQNYANDIAIIYTNQPYVLSVFTNNVTDANDKIARISKIVYDYQVNNK
jgi:beta-lactamase class A